jgi:hypothetical protein
MAKEETRSIRFNASLLDMLKQEASDNNRSFQNEVIKRLEESLTPDTSVVVGWLRLDRWGEIDDRGEVSDAYAECSCGQDIDITAAYMAVMSNGTLAGPFCAGCATSE